MFFEQDITGHADKVGRTLCLVRNTKGRFFCLADKVGRTLCLVGLWLASESLRLAC